ncbi:MAG: elongation factor G [Acholeplasmataceae bacterium]
MKFEELLEEIREKLGKRAVPFCYPIGKEENFEGFVNIVTMRAKIYDGKESKDADIWEEKLPKVNELHDMMLESVAETSEELLEKFFSGETLSEEEVKNGLHTGVVNGELTPVLVGSATKAIGIRTMIDMLFDYLPAPNELEPLKAMTKNGEIEVKTVEDEPLQAYVFKSTVDPFLGTINYLKIVSGSLHAGQEVVISPIDEQRKVSNVFTLMGKTQINVETFHAGDICTVSKVDGLETGMTVSDAKHPAQLTPVEVPNPVIYIAVHPKNKNDEDKISGALHRLNLEDPTFQILRNKETKQLLLGGQGMTHLHYVLDRMKTMFKVDVDIEEQKIVYRETIKKRVEAEGKHKKQSGGAGQFGHVWMRFEPSQELFEFAEEVFGGAVPKNYFPAVEKGLIETFEHGLLAGFPVINVKATLYDGSYHAVDSNELSFKLAAGLAFKNACKEAQPTILEPIVKLEVFVKEKFVGDVMGDMNKRRGRVIGMDPQADGSQIIDCEVPESEIVSYAIDLKAMTQGSGSFTREFIRYDEVPQQLIPKIVAQYKEENH